jgi:hypothetical protein
MRSVLAVLTLGAALASVAPAAWASDSVDYPSLPSADQPAAAVATVASDSAVAGPSGAPSLPYADSRQENMVNLRDECWPR